MRKALIGLCLAAMLALPVMGGAPVCPPVEEEGVWMCVDGEAVQMEGRLTTGIVVHRFGAERYQATTAFYIPFIRLGYEAPLFSNMFLRAGYAIERIYTPFDSFHIIDVGGKYQLTSNTSVLVGLDFGIDLDMGRIGSDTDWTMFVGGHYAFGGFDPGLGVFLQGHIPLAFSPVDPLFGAFFSGGLEFRW